MPRCANFDLAVRIMRYVNDVQGVTAGDGERYLRNGLKELSAAACTANPAEALAHLRARFAADTNGDTNRAATATMLREACHALARGQDPLSLRPKPAADW
jgi:hypothetical protein